MSIKKQTIKFDDGTEVTLRQPLVRDMKAVANEKNQSDIEMKLISNLTETAPSEMENWTMLDYGKVAKVLGDFLPDNL